MQAVSCQGPKKRHRQEEDPRSSLNGLLKATPVFKNNSIVLIFVESAHLLSSSDLACYKSALQVCACHSLCSINQARQDWLLLTQVQFLKEGIRVACSILLISCAQQARH